MSYNKICILILLCFLPIHVFSADSTGKSVIRNLQADTINFSPKETTINSNWEFTQNDTLRFSEVGQLGNWSKVNLPHTWNKEDVIDEVNGYHRGVGWYRKDIIIESNEHNNIFLKFEGSNVVTEVFVNGSKAGNHQGGYTAFVIDITQFISFEKKNKILIKVDNRHNRDVTPLSADFNFYGGIYRDLWLVRKKKFILICLIKAQKAFMPARRRCPMKWQRSM